MSVSRNFKWFQVIHYIQGVREWSPKNFRVSVSGKMWSNTFIPFLDKLHRFLKIKLFPAVLGLLKYCFMQENSSLFNEFVRKLSFFWHGWASLKSEWNERFNGRRVPGKAQFTHERVEYNVFLFDEALKGSKSLKIFKISLTFRFNKLWHLSKSVHTGENSQILTVSNKKRKIDEKTNWYHCSSY
jgi:hypothetical protein